MTRSKHLILVALAALLLGACSGADAPTATHTPAQGQFPAAQSTATGRPVTEAPASTSTSMPTEMPSVSSPTATQASPPATDTPIPDNSPSFLDVRPDDWVRGPADAPVTIIEYSDFQ
jgi:protein-disulfide isomerase